MITFAQNLYELRKKNNLSQEQLAEQLDVSRQAISKWENGQSVPEVEKIILISELFHVSTDYLLKDIEEDKENQSYKLRRVKKIYWSALILCMVGLVLLTVWILITLYIPNTLEKNQITSMVKMNGSFVLVLIGILMMLLGSILLIVFRRK